MQVMQTEAELSAFLAILDLLGEYSPGGLSADKIANRFRVDLSQYKPSEINKQVCNIITNPEYIELLCIKFKEYISCSGFIEKVYCRIPTEKLVKKR